MTISPRKKLYLALSFAILGLHLVVATFAKSSFALTIFGDAVPCCLLVIAILAFTDNIKANEGTLSLFWKLSAAGLFTMLISETYWFYFDSLRRHGSPSPVFGDSFFLLAHVFLLFALALYRIRWPRPATCGFAGWILHCLRCGGLRCTAILRCLGRRWSAISRSTIPPTTFWPWSSILFLPLPSCF